MRSGLVAQLLAQEKADLLAFFKADPRMLRLLALASETASTFDTFITT
jgi:hypothetical protein